jgi:hypothetical protein
MMSRKDLLGLILDHLKLKKNGPNGPNGSHIPFYQPADIRIDILIIASYCS